MAASLPNIDANFFSTAESAARQLESEGKPAIANALRSLGARMLQMKLLI